MGPQLFMVHVIGFGGSLCHASRQKIEISSAQGRNHRAKIQGFKHTVDGSKIPRPTTWNGAKPVVDNGINYQPQLVLGISERSTVLQFGQIVFCYNGLLQRK